MSVAPGTVVAGDYRIVSPLARGGMGEVYVAEQISTGKRRALKLMKSELVDVPGLLARFEQEARVGARIASEHVVEVVGAGVDSTLRAPWLAMELLEGESLEAMLEKRGCLPWDEARLLFSQMGHAVGAAHRAGVVHRDLKPENVFVARTQQVGVAHRVKVLDFGIAKLVADAKSTNTGQLSLGTPRYMAPEQTGGQAITPATDVWALGLIAYRVLTGRYYWRHGDGAPGDTVMALMREILFEPLVPASRRATEQGVLARLPAPGFDAWFAHAVAREPSERYANAHDAMHALDVLLANARPASAPLPAALGTMPSPGVASTGGSPAGVAPPSPGATAVSVAAATPVQRSRIGLVVGLFVGVAALASGGVGAVLYAQRQDSGSKRRKSRDEESDDEEEPDDETEAPRPKKARPGPDDVEATLPGRYEIVDARNPASLGGKSYGGTVIISAVGKALRVEWNVGGTTYVGVGFVDANQLVVAYGTGLYGVAAYAPVNGSLVGRGTSSDSGGVIEEQKLVGALDYQGAYRIDGVSGGYGTATMSPRGAELVEIRAQARGAELVGTGLREGNRLIVGYAAPGVAGGVVVYTIRGKELAGVWAAHGHASTGTERLEKR